MKLYFLLLLCVLCVPLANSQSQQFDTISRNDLEEVVITAQITPQSIKRAVNSVRVISRQDIERLAAVNLSDVLNQYLNITIVPNALDGRSTVSLFGLDGQYFKVLIDNIPLVSDTGTGNNTDLTQVALNEVERIEIIEGAMGVTHGANAVSGILNIVTRKNMEGSWEVNAALQEETVSGEYDFVDKGRHIQDLKVAHRFRKHWFASAGAVRNDFAGYFDGRMGQDYLENDGLRGHRQLPKEQWTTHALVAYDGGVHKLSYRFESFFENVDFFNPVVIPIPNYPFEDTHYARDRRYITYRRYNHLNANGRFYNLTYNVSASHQLQKRDLESYNYQLETREETGNDRNTYQSKELLYATGSVSGFSRNKRIDFQIGYELVQELGFYDSTAGTFRDENQQPVDIRRRMENYDVYFSGELHLNDHFTLRPGARYSFQSFFRDQYAVSVGFRYLLAAGWEWRFAAGHSYRTPNFDELYTYMVDSNHDIRGNAELVPEAARSLEMSILKKSSVGANLHLTQDLSVTFMDIKDRISLVYVQLTPFQKLQYKNIDSYRMWNIAGSQQLTWKQLKARMGVALIGISQTLDLMAAGVSSDDRYLYTFNANASVSYSLRDWKTQLSLFFKYNGRQQQYVSTVDSSGETVFVRSTIQGFGWMDASLRQPLLKNRLNITIGARNLLNVKTLRQSRDGDTTGGAHTTESSLSLGYGRSCFIRMMYNIFN